MSSPAKAVSLRISAIVHATEDSRKVKQGIGNICRLEGSAEPVMSHAKGHHGNQIETLVFTAKSPKAVENCMRDIWKRLSVLDKETIFSSLASRTDSSGTLHLRIDKQWALRGVIRLQDSDPIKLGISLMTSRAKRHEVVHEIQRFLTELSRDVDKSH